MFPATTKFLIADDTRTIRVMLREILQNLGYHDIIEAADGTEALQLLKSTAAAKAPIEFIICDWNMPGMTGLDLLELRNADRHYRSVPFLMVTIESERDYVLRAVALGVSDYVVKPFSESTLKAKMLSVWNRLPKI